MEWLFTSLGMWWLLFVMTKKYGAKVVLLKDVEEKLNDVIEKSRDDENKSFLALWVRKLLKCYYCNGAFIGFIGALFFTHFNIIKALFMGLGFGVLTFYIHILSITDVYIRGYEDEDFDNDCGCNELLDKYLNEEDEDENREDK